MRLHEDEIKDFLEEKYRLYNNAAFIETDPVQIPHRFSRKEDIEIAGFFSAIIAWGKRPMIIRNAQRLMDMMEGEPYYFVLNAKEKDMQRFQDFCHRTFQPQDVAFFVKSLKNIYRNYGGLEDVFTKGFLKNKSLEQALVYFRGIFLSPTHEARSEKHIANVLKGSSAKRLNMFLRWMVRPDKAGVDFGLWSQIPSKALMMPLDVHTGNVGRKLNLLKRKQDDWKAVLELTEKLKEYDPDDPVKYDYALFGLGVFEGF